MGRVRTVIVPVVNPEGFNISREAGEANGVGGGRPAVDDDTPRPPTCSSRTSTSARTAG